MIEFFYNFFVDQILTLKMCKIVDKCCQFGYFLSLNFGHFVSKKHLVWILKATSFGYKPQKSDHWLTKKLSRTYVRTYSPQCKDRIRLNLNNRKIRIFQ